MLKEELKRIEDICERLGASSEIIQELTTFRVHPVTIRPVLNGKRGSFEALRVWHCNPWTPNPFRGGIRRRPKIDKGLLKVFAADMTVKCALTNIQSGGAKGWLDVDPAQYTPDEQRYMLELVIDEFLIEHGIPHPDIDVFGPDMGMAPEDMYFLYHRIGKLNRRFSSPNIAASITGKPVDKDGLPGREEATGRGGLIVLDTFRKLSESLPEAPTLAIQGFGNVGLHMARLASEFNFNVIAISDVNGGITNPSGLNFVSVNNWYQEHGTFHGYTDAEEISNEELLQLQTDVLIPAAVENQITEQNADKLRSSVIAELANKAVTSDAISILDQRNICYWPSKWISAGGVAMSGREWSHNRGHRQHKVEQPGFKRTIEEELREIMKSGTEEIFEKSRRESISLIDAADLLAFDKICKELSRKHGYKYK